MITDKRGKHADCQLFILIHSNTIVLKLAHFYNSLDFCSGRYNVRCKLEAFKRRSLKPQTRLELESGDLPFLLREDLFGGAGWRRLQLTASTLG